MHNPASITMHVAGESSQTFKRHHADVPAEVSEMSAQLEYQVY